MIYRLFVFLFILMMLPHCATTHKEPSPLVSDMKTETASSVAALKIESLPDDVRLLEEITQKHPDQSMRIRAHLQLAKLYSSYKNQNPDYQRALKELEIYLSFNPADGGTDEVQSLLGILRELDRVSEENRKTRQKVNQLTRENKELKESIGKLKNLDIKMEEKRKKVK